MASEDPMPFAILVYMKNIISGSNMSKSRIMGAGSAGSTVHHCNVNLNTAGGTKKQGSPFSINDSTLCHHPIKLNAYGTHRDVIFTINQLGGIGHTATVTRGGVRPREPYTYNKSTYGNVIGNSAGTTTLASAITTVSGTLKSNTLDATEVDSAQTIGSNLTTGSLTIGGGMTTGTITIGNNIGADSSGATNITGSTIKQSVPCLGGGTVSNTFGNADNLTSLSTTYCRKSTDTLTALACYTILGPEIYSSGYFELVVSGSNQYQGGYAYKGFFGLTQTDTTLVATAVSTLLSVGLVPTITFTGTNPITLHIHTALENNSTSQTFIATLIAYPTITIDNELYDFTVTAV